MSTPSVRRMSSRTTSDSPARRASSSSSKKKATPVKRSRSRVSASDEDDQDVNSAATSKRATSTTRRSISRSMSTEDTLPITTAVPSSTRPSSSVNNYPGSASNGSFVNRIRQAVSSFVDRINHESGYGSEEDEPTSSDSAHHQHDHEPFSQVMYEADLGKKQLGFHNDQYIEDISVEFLYKPHTVTALILLIGALLFLAFSLESSTDQLQNLRYGAGAVCLFVLTLGLLIFPAGPFIRPHPLVWRFAFGLGVLYEIWLIFLLFQTKDQARASMKFFDNSLGVPIEERSYAADCSFNWVTISGAVDMFVVSHFIGWMVKALILRDMVICWVISIQWELIEILFTHMLPNFAECWWDQWILDVLLANGLGIWLGCRLASYLEMKQYRWSSYQSIPSYIGKAKRTILQFTPSSWTRVQWKSTSSINRLIGVQILIVAMHLEELNAFFLKYILWVPPECKLNLFRLIIWAFVGVPSLRQIYSYMSDPHCKRIGHQTFLSVCILATELLVIFKFGRGEFTKPMTDNTKIGFGIFMVGYVIVLLFLASRTQRKEHTKKEIEAY